jgi:hypothetical protein
MNRIVPMFPGRTNNVRKGYPSGQIGECPCEKLKSEILAQVKECIDKSVLRKVRPWLKSTEVETKLKITSDDLRKLTREGWLPYCKIGRNIYYDPVDVDMELRRRKVKGSK